MLFTSWLNSLNLLNFPNHVTNLFNSVTQQEIADQVSVIQYLFNQIPESID